MEIIDYIILATIGVAVIFAILFIHKSKKIGKTCYGCSGDCTNCNKKNK